MEKKIKAWAVVELSGKITSWNFSSYHFTHQHCILGIFLSKREADAFAEDWHGGRAGVVHPLSITYTTTKVTKK